MKKDVERFKKISEEIIDESAEFLSIDFPKREKYLLEIFEKREELIKMYEELEEPKEQKKSNGTIIYEVILNEKDIEYLEHIAEVIFGNESPKPIVIKEDFIGYNNYSFENGVLTMKCHIIYNDIKDILNTYDEPVFAFSNHINQAYGIEFRSFSKGLLMDGDKLKGASTSIDFNDLK